MSGNLRATLRSQEKAIRIVDWDHLSSSQVNWNEFETVNSNFRIILLFGGCNIYQETVTTPNPPLISCISESDFDS